MKAFVRGASVALTLASMLITAGDVSATESGSAFPPGATTVPLVATASWASREDCRQAAACALRAGLRPGGMHLEAAAAATAATERAVPARSPLADVPAFQSRARNRAGVPWMVAGAALIVGGALVEGDVGTLLMAGGVVSAAYGLFVYF